MVLQPRIQLIFLFILVNMGLEISLTFKYCRNCKLVLYSATLGLTGLQMLQFLCVGSCYLSCLMHTQTWFCLDVSVLWLLTPVPFGISCCLDSQIIQRDVEAAVSHSPKNHKAQTLQVACTDDRTVLSINSAE